MNPESVSRYILGLADKISELESENRCYRYANEKLTEELSKAKEDIETLKCQKAILSGKVTPNYLDPW